MGLKAQLSKEEFEKLDAGIKTLYRELTDPDDKNRGKYRLVVESVDGWGIDHTEGLKQVLAELKDERGKLREFKKRFGDSPDADKILSDLSELAELRKKGSGPKVEELLAAKERELSDKHKGEIKIREDRIKVLLDNLQDALIRSEASAAIAEHGGSVDLMLPIVQSAAFLAEHEGKFTARIRGENNLARVTRKEGSTDPMGLREYVSILRADKRYEAAFKGTPATGPGVTPPGGGPTPGQSHTISSEDARDVHKYRAAREAAEKAKVDLVVLDPK